MYKLTVLLIFVATVSQGQTFTPSPGNNITVTIAGSTYKAFCPDDYLTCDPEDIYFHVFFHGDFTNTAGTENQVMGKWIKSGGPWNGKVLLNNGDTARVCILSIPDYGTDPFKYGNAVKVAIQSFSRLNTPLDGTTPIPGHFSMAGLSGGPGRIYSWQVNDTTAVRTLFKRGVIMSPVFMGPSNSWTAGGNWFVWWDRSDPNSGTPPSTGPQWYANLLGTKDSTSTNIGCHCNTVWDSCMTITGLNSHTGGTAATNRIRRLIDPEDGLTPTNDPPVANAGADQEILLPTSSVSVNGSSSFDPDGTITTYAWTKISGPPTFTITDPSNVSTTITGLVEGVYVFRLTVTDDATATDADDITITVTDPPTFRYLVGQLFQKTIGGENFLCYLPDTSQRPTLKQHFVFSMSDSSGKDSSYIVSRALGKKIINGWNGKQPLTSGDTACFNIVIQITNNTQKNSMETVLQWALDSIPDQCFDTTQRARNIMTGIGQAAASQALYLLDEFKSPSISQPGVLKFWRAFGKYTSIDHRDNGRLVSTRWDSIIQPFKSWWIVGGSNGYPYLQGYSKQGYDSAHVYNAEDTLTKYKIISGASYSSVTWDSVYSSLGTGAENNVFRWWADDVEYGYGGSKIIINPNGYVDFSGADGLASKNTFYYLDSKFDPKGGVTSTIDTTDGRCYTKETIVHRRWGQRDIWINFQDVYVITAIYGKRRDGSSHYPDTITWYSRGDRINNLNFLAADKRTRSDFLFQAISIGSGTAWEKLWEGSDTTQYLLLNLRRNLYTQPFTQGTDGNYQDFIFYGYKLSAGETKYNVASEAQLDDWINNTKRSTLKKHSGANFSNIYMVKDYKNLNQIRGYSAQIFTHNSKYPTNSLELQLNQDSTGYVWHNEQVLADEPDKFNYLSENGTNQWVVDTQSKRIYPPENPNYGSQNQKPTDSIGMDAAFPENYKTLASNLTITAATFGFDPQPNVKKRYSGPYPAPALGAHKIYHGLEIGNEDDIDVHDSAYMTPLERAAMQWSCWDGMLGTMNTGDSIEFGIKLADPSMKVLTGAFVGWNYKPAAAMVIACKIIAQSDTLPFDILAGHIYHANTKRDPGVSSSITAPQAHGIPPDMFGYPDDVDSMARYLRRFINKPPSQIELTNNEWGWDKTYMRPDCVSGCDSNVFNTTLYGLPYQDAGFDSSKWQSVLLMRGTALFAASHYNSSVVFTFNDDHDPQSSGIVGPYTFSGINGYYYRNPSTFNIDSVEYTVAAYHYRGMLKRFKNYYVEQVIDKTEGGRYVMKWRSDINPDTTMYMIWEADSLQSMVNYNIPVAANQLIKEWVPSVTNIDGTEGLVSPSGGNYAANAGLEPRFFIVYTNPSASGSERNYFRGSLRRNKFINQ